MIRLSEDPNQIGKSSTMGPGRSSLSSLTHSPTHPAAHAPTHSRTHSLRRSHSGYSARHMSINISLYESKLSFLKSVTTMPLLQLKKWTIPQFRHMSNQCLIGHLNFFNHLMFFNIMFIYSRATWGPHSEIALCASQVFDICSSSFPFLKISLLT